MNQGSEAETGAAERPSFVTVMCVLVLASSASIMSTDMFSPSLPSLTEYFSTSERLVQLTISLNVLAFGAGQLLLGPLSDRFGRRPVMLAGIACFTLASLACTMVTSIEQLIAVRIVQGVAACVEAVVGFAIIRDLFSGAERVRALAIWGTAIAAVPALAPIAGGYVHVLVGWRANFVIIAAAGTLAGLLIWRVLGESTRPDRNALAPRRLLQTFAELLFNRRFVAYSVMLGAGLGGIFAFVTAGPFVLIDGFGIPVERFGLLQAAAVGAFFVGSLTSARFADSGRLAQLLGLGIAIGSIGIVMIATIHLTGTLTPLTLAIGMCGVGFGLGPIFAVGPSFALDATHSPAGAASAILGGLEMLGAGAASVLVSVLPGGAQSAMVQTMVLCGVVVLITWIVARWPDRGQP